MRSIIFIIILLFTVQVFSQVEVPLFNKMEGTWESTYDSSGTLYKETIQMKWSLNHNYFVITVMDGMDQKYMKYSEKECFFFTRDNNNNLTGWNFDYLGFNN